MYREVQANGSDAKIRTAEIHATSILTLDRAEKTEHEDRKNRRCGIERATTIRFFLGYGLGFRVHLSVVSSPLMGAQESPLGKRDISFFPCLSSFLAFRWEGCARERSHCDAP